jgi:catechol 2,3-dioxygenase-like lactoylglutathione lyase family enzyme
MEVESMQYSVAFSHIGISVPDIGKAIEFYKNVFGWYHLAGPWPIKRNPEAPDKFTDTLYGEDQPSFKLAHMSTGNGVGIELLEFDGNYPSKAKVWEHRRHGVFHFGITVPDFEEFIARVIANGGRQVTDIKTLPKGDAAGNPFIAVFVEDPFHNIFEVYRHSYEVQSRL